MSIDIAIYFKINSKKQSNKKTAKINKQTKYKKTKRGGKFFAFATLLQTKIYLKQSYASFLTSFDSIAVPNARLNLADMRAAHHKHTKS